jgi:hypothetical protein
MLEANIRLATDGDDGHLLKAVTDEQDWIEHDGNIAETDDSNRSATCRYVCRSRGPRPRCCESVVGDNRVAYTPTRRLANEDLDTCEQHERHRSPNFGPAVRPPLAWVTPCEFPFEPMRPCVGPSPVPTPGLGPDRITGKTCSMPIPADLSEAFDQAVRSLLLGTAVAMSLP